MANTELGTEELDPVLAARDLEALDPDEHLDLDLQLGIDDSPDLHLPASEQIGQRRSGPPDKASAHGWRAVLAALKQKGVRESPCGSNNNPYSRYFGYGPQFWCADFVSWAFDTTGNRDRKVPWGYPSNVSNITTWGKRTGNVLRGPKPGAMFNYRNGKHIGFVVRVEGSRFLTVEGNTSGPDGRVCWVWTHSRLASGPFVFVRMPD